MESYEKKELVETLLKTADKLFRKLLPSVPEDLLTLDITMPQMKIMLILYLHGPMRMSDIASGLDVTLPTATSLVDKLVEKNYLVRHNQTDDRRVVLCQLSNAGQKAFGKIWESARVRSSQLLELMDTPKLKMFVEVLETMLESAETDSQQNIVASKVQVKQ
jgi:DNA-binding MarR family transcriptional regulator